jgi:hypothetical protein
MGIRYVTFRVLYELKRRSGVLKLSYPINPPFQTWVTLSDWRKSAPAFFFDSRSNFSTTTTPSNRLLQKANRIFQGDVQFFHGEWGKIDPHDWLTNHSTGYRYDTQNHWTEIPDFHPEFGDIKYVWERSRFSFLQTILRYDTQTGSDSSNWVFDQLESWITYNPINQGPNYRCSQETSLRVFNWTLALYFYRDSPNLTEDRFHKILFHIYWQLRHVRSNIHFSRIGVRNNHAITETLALYSAGLLFPFFEEAAEWKVSGKKWFEQEIEYQVYDDGAYLQFSFNYHRVVIQLLTWAIALAHRHGEKFQDVVYQRAYASLTLLLTCQDTRSGQLPNYGANDGSLFFQWNDTNFRDYRPALDALHYLLTSANFYPAIFEDREWFGIERGLNLFSTLKIGHGIFSFPQGGIHIFRKEGFLVMINCARYKDRPSQADNLHLDVWFQGNNVLRDAGSYRYNAEPEMVKFFFGTESHNTIMLDDNDQMLKGPRFIWMDWSAAIEAKWEVHGEENIFHGVARVYQYMGNVIHARTVRIDAAGRSIIITDQISGARQKTMRQLWHIDPAWKDRIHFQSETVQGKPIRNEEMKYYSPTYGVLEDSLQIEFQTTQHLITTQIRFA